MTSSQEFETYIPVYDSVPEKWEEARPMLVETLKKITQGVNTRSVGFMLDQEVLTGEQFIPSSNNPGGADPSSQYRSVFRKVIVFGPVTAGLNQRPHGVVVDSNFSLIELYGSVTNSTTLVGNPINQPNITYDATNIYITAAAAFDRCWAFFSYIQEQ
jgi:hypothetical protein